jgi:diguanylate cyclase (GGDEF)-like protein/PAS domain S-box-containing protein
MEKPAESSRTELHARRRPLAAARSGAPPAAAPAELTLGEQAYFNDIYLLAPVGYFVLGFDTTILQMNVVGADLLGLARDNPERLAFRAFVADRFLDDFERLLRRAANSGRPERCDLQMAGCRGRQGFPATLRASGDSGGQAVRLVLEPAEGKLAVLERSEERLRRIVHSAEEGVWEIDAAARTSFVNPRMARMLGYDIEEMLDRPLAAFMDDEGRAILERNIARREPPHDADERREFKFLRKDGSGLWVTLATNPIFDGAGGYLGALALVRELTASRGAGEASWRQANFDALTALPNGLMLQDRLEQEIKRAQRDGAQLALLSIALDGFKRVDDALGREHAEALLVEAARRIGVCVRASDTVARPDGDEFVVILSGLEDVSGIDRITRTMLARLGRPFTLGATGATISASIGIALFPSDASAPEQLLRHAGEAMRAARRAGANRYSYFTPALQLTAQARQQAALDLRAALSGQQLELHYQPIVNLQSGKIERAEALLRWRHPERGLLAPAEFLPFAESGGLMLELGDWVFRQAARQARAWRDELGPAFQVGINQSPAQFRGDTALYAGWLNYAAELGLAPDGIVIEIAEGVLMDGAAQVAGRLRELREMGLQVALDNFGAGHASLAQLKHFGIDLLKLDRGFIRHIERDSGELALCEALIVMAHKLGLRVVAEGVETAAQSGLLAMAGCDFAQGYVFAAPMPAAEFGALARGAAAPSS